MPFVAEKVTEILLHIAIREEGDDEKVSNEGTNGVQTLEKEQKAISEQAKTKCSILKSKIHFMSKVLKMQRVLREQSEHILKIKELNNNKLPQGILLDGKEMQEAFNATKKVDSKNERRPY